MRGREIEEGGEGREMDGNQGKSLYLITILYRQLLPNYRQKNGETSWSFTAMTQVTESAWLDSQHVSRSPVWMIICSSNVEFELVPFAGYKHKCP